MSNEAGTRVTINGEPSAFLHWGRAGEIRLVLPPDLARKLTVTTQQETGVVLAQADIDQLMARTDTGAVVLSGAAGRIIIALRARGPDIVNADTGAERGDTVVRGSAGDKSGAPGGRRHRPLRDRQRDHRRSALAASRDSSTSGRPNNVTRPGSPKTTMRAIPLAVTSSAAIPNARSTPSSSRR